MNINVNEGKKFTGSTAFRGIVVFLLNFAVLLGLLVLFVWIDHRSGYANYISDNLSVLFFTVGCLFLLYWIVYLYYYFGDKAFLGEMKNIWLIFLTIDLCLAIFHVCDFLDVYTRPFALFALLILFLVNYRDSVFLNIVFSLFTFLTDVFLHYDYFSQGIANEYFSVFMICLLGGTFAVFFAQRINTRVSVLGVLPIIMLPSIFILSLLEVASFDTFNLELYITHVEFMLLACVFSTAFFMLILPIFEWMFRRLTVFRLHEMTGQNVKLLRRLKNEAPGTYNHSIVVAQLAETCAAEIGEDPELARAAAYYHDVGKLHQPEYFTENQAEHNLHNELAPELSADIIRSHTKDGYDLLNAARMPRFFADVALQHHGTMPITYFYTKALRMSDGAIKIEDYSYTGPKPKSKIAAIIMIADSCEAAARAMPDRSAEKVEKTVRSVIQQRMDMEQFSECEITMNELQIIKNTLVSALSGVYHHRIKYPDVRFTRSGVEDNGGSIHDRD